MRIRKIILVSFCLLIISCGDAEDSDESNIESLALLSYQSPCYIVDLSLCYETTSNDFFYSPIEGFDFIWGHNYQITLKVSEIDNPPEDISSLSYELEEIVTEAEDDIGTTYEYEQIELLEHTFTIDSGTYYFLLTQPFECHEGVDCDTLINLNNSGGLVDVTFNYLGDGQIELTYWN